MNFSDAAVSENVSVQNIERGMAISVTANTARQAAGAHDASASGQGARSNCSREERTVGRIGIFVMLRVVEFCKKRGQMEGN